jgi:CheY-like chemotaxis protein
MSSTVLRAGGPRILCVDDEPHILESLRDTLRRRFDVKTASSGAEGLAQLSAAPNQYALIVSDMRMPVMTGSVFLREARRVAPDASRILLTGYADLDAAISAVNEAELFRFLTKPCQPGDLLDACQAGVDRFQALSAERALLEQTLRGSVKALSDILALASPAAFGRSARVRKLVASVAEKLGSDELWEAEVAAMLVNLGAITLPQETAEKLYAGDTLSSSEQDAIARVPSLTRKILENIPRLEGVLEILDIYRQPFVSLKSTTPAIQVGAQILRIVLDFDALDVQGADHTIALAAMRGRTGRYDPALLDVMDRVIGSDSSRYRVSEIGCGQLRPGMVLAADVRSDKGGLLIARGASATEQLVTRMINMRTGSVREPLMIIESEGAPHHASRR